VSTEDRIRVRVRFASLLQRHTGILNAEIEVSRDPGRALAHIIGFYGIPWEDDLKNTTGVFINRIPASRFIREERELSEGDSISFIPMVGGG
jgi:molybdopterin converting factor small subunit